MAQTILRTSIAGAATRRRDCACANALQFAILTDRGAIPPKAKDNLSAILGRYLS
jgi:5'-methylthioadenosine phosphorylase